jgi:shikimate kinase
MKIYLIGFMGCGKTRLGGLLAERLGFQFLDLDEAIESAAGLDIPALFRQAGEAEFRQLEANCLRQTGALQRTVVATGGGTPCFHENMDWLSQNGIVVYLHAEVGVLVQRLLPERGKRPLLHEMEPDQLPGFIEGRLREREPFYLRAHFQLNLTAGDNERAVEQFSAYLKRFIPDGE